MIECRGCCIQNIFNDYTPDDFLVCSQCRERLVEPDFCKIYRQFECRDCGFNMFILNQTEFKAGESACQCSGTNLQQRNPRTFLQEVEKAGGLDIADEPINDDSDWYRSEPITESDYDEIFDRDPGSDDS